VQVESFLERSAQLYPSKTAVVCGERRITYWELDEQTSRLAAALVRHGVARGDRVAIYLENSVEAVAAMWAALKAGAVFLMVNPTTKADKFAFILNDCRARVLVTDGARLAAVDGQIGKTSHLATVLLAGAEEIAASLGPWQTLYLGALLGRDGEPIPEVPRRCIDIDLAALIYTSGSTGFPKGVMLTHLNVVTAATSITTYLENTPEDVILNVLPLAFDYGLYQVLMAAKVGGTVVLERSFTYPRAVIDTIVRERITGLPIVPTISAILLQMDLARYDFSSLRYITNTAAALPTRHVLELQRLFPHVKIFSMYGLTECKRVAYLPPSELSRRPTSVGKAIPNTEVYVVDEQGRRVGPGVVGELVIRGAHVMKGYWERPAETDAVLRPGPLPGERVLYSGDLFKTDEEGFLYFVGRKDDIIKTRGEKVSPKEVENVLYGLEGVAEAAVIGVPDPVLGSAIKAVVALAEGSALTAQDILRHCRRHLEDLMVPKLVEIRGSLPKTATGKISRRMLEEGAEAIA
jgi:long-chain acyl-CoA synthetase